MFVGEIEIVPLPDAVGILGDLDELFAGVPADEWEPYRALYPGLFDGSGLRLPITVHAFRHAGKTLLLDTHFQG